MGTRRELVQAVGARYRASPRGDRGAILDEFVATTGYHRKHAIRLLAAEPKSRPARASSRQYGEAVAEALATLWEVSGRVCSKRLKPMMASLVPALVRHGRLPDDPALHAQLEAISPATIDRLLAPSRYAALKGRRRRSGQSSAVRRSVPIRTFGDWNDPALGYVEVDFVAHSGVTVSGTFIQTLVLTDVASGWTECVPVLTRDSALVIDAISTARRLFPFPLRGVDFDNDSVFMNERVVGWCLSHGLEVTRARAYRKNDQAWVEQKNGAIVRRLVGYGRFEGLESLQMLTRLYAASRLHTNLFQPSFKLKSKVRTGAKVAKRYHSPQPPAHRILLLQEASKKTKTRLQQMLTEADPVLLFEEIEAAQIELGTRVDQRGTTKPALPVVLPRKRQRDGEQLEIHRRPYRRTKPIPPRTRMLDPYEEQIKLWLRTDPAITGADVLQRLQAHAPEAAFKDKHLRTIQRALEQWRSDAVRSLIQRINDDQQASTFEERSGNILR